MGFLTLIFFFFNFCGRFFLEMGFPIHSLSVQGLMLCLANDNSLNCMSGLVRLCFLIRRLYRWFLRPEILEMIFSI